MTAAGLPVAILSKNTISLIQFATLTERCYFFFFFGILYRLVEGLTLSAEVSVQFSVSMCSCVCTFYRP